MWYIPDNPEVVMTPVCTHFSVYYYFLFLKYSFEQMCQTVISLEVCNII